MNLAEVAPSGDRLKTLEVLRDHIAATLDEAQPQYVANLAKQLATVLAEIESMAPPEVHDTVDDLASARAKRRSSAG